MRTGLLIATLALVIISSWNCNNNGEMDFQYKTEQFADLGILRFRVPGFETLPVEKKELIYYLYEAALSGRDIIYDQNYRHNLLIRRTLEAIMNSYAGDRTAPEFEKFVVYTKRVWFSNGIHHHYSSIKFLPDFTEAYFEQLLRNSPAVLDIDAVDSADALLTKLKPILFDPDVDSKRVNLDPEVDQVLRSANNYYEGVTQKEVEAYYARRIDKDNPRPVSYGLNSKLVFENGEFAEKVWKVGGMYGSAIEKIVYWLEKAAAVAENKAQKTALGKLIEYYKTGDLQVFDEYSIAWVKDTASTVDVVNGFIETYGDALGYRGAYESVVSFKDLEATKRIEAIGKQAQWFEDNSTIMEEHKKEKVTGISARVITVVVESGDASPNTPIGINLPNANWIRATEGSKSVSLGNIIEAYSESSKSGGYLQEFCFSQEELDRARQYGTLGSNLHTDMHEVIGHASGKLNDDVGTPRETLKGYAATLEEARSDLVALYYAIDPKLVEIGVMPSLEVGKAEYDNYIRNALLWQLRRLKLGENMEESHMRNRLLVGKWAYEKGKDDNVIEKKTRDGKSYFVINDYEKLRDIFGQLLREVQRIKSEGDYAAGRELVENHGVKVDREVHEEVLERYAKLNLAPYYGFINPKLVPVMDGDKLIGVRIEYPDDFMAQMLEYARDYSLLPTYN